MEATIEILDNTCIVKYIYYGGKKMMKSISLKIEEEQLKILDAVSKETHIPKSALIREGIGLVIRQHKEDIITSDLKKEIDLLIREDKELLKKLA
ncbi:MAG: ribbon-helix-helix domain-containing protein [Candidatus Scalindua sp. AMX11]|nr:MAG: ribbon-helix-helix domain-containing protein [Candidatus Scalindua sp.]RZV69310.1 MAG: ribbon-helix-helix domain-containing protein [Candidatus Scalindua sp. SCAELEC01]TDE66777.1 MAG: ribbon-helix-helix domain-containing protein [Candidatus Scalindua sp. AMX11]GJQ60394.1 MAG: hypothetical protein SCALA701_31950 [Candidatus Scalindua sp.]